jgi:hypothetical protein
MAKKMVVPVMSDDDLEIDDAAMERATDQLIERLDAAHARATSPSARRRLEVAMKKARAELADIRKKAKALDLSYRRWVEHLDAILAHVDKSSS